MNTGIYYVVHKGVVMLTALQQKKRVRKKERKKSTTWARVECVCTAQQPRRIGSRVYWGCVRECFLFNTLNHLLRGATAATANSQSALTIFLASLTAASSDARSNTSTDLI